MRQLYDLVRPALGDSAVLQTGLLIALLVLLVQCLVSRVKEWWQCRDLETKVFLTDHSKGPPPSTCPRPFHCMPRRAGRAAERLRVTFDNPVYLHQYVAHGHMQLGPVFRDGLGGPVDLVFVADLDCIPVVHRASGVHPGHIVPDAWTLYLKIKNKKRGIFFMDGPEWLEHRKVLNQRLLRASAHSWAMPQLGKCSASLMDALWEAQLGGTLNTQLMRLLYKWALECMFNISLGRPTSEFRCGRDPECEFDKFVDAIHRMFLLTASMGRTSAEEAMNENSEVWNKFCEACDTALDVAGRFITEAAEDILQKDTEHQQDQQQELCLLERLLMEDKLPQEMAVRLIADLFLAAADTTAWSAMWLIYVSSSHVAYASSARQQVRFKTNLVADGEDPLCLTQEDLKDLTWCKLLLKETLRLYPVAPFLTRLVAQDCVLGGYSVPANTMIIVSLYSIGRDPKYFSCPGDFDALRWAVSSQDVNRNDFTSSTSSTVRHHGDACEEHSRSFHTASPLHHDCNSSSHADFHLSRQSNGNFSSEECPSEVKRAQVDQKKSNLKKLSALPWGIGSRNCVGRTMAETLLTLFEAHLLHRFHVIVKNQDVHLKMRMISVPSEALDVVLTEATSVERDSCSEETM
ncbi:Cytochrome P450 [Trinorchestia longiramus]|nr:Cytochrome P450 [Trinorchestia longiramus]